MFRLYDSKKCCGSWLVVFGFNVYSSFYNINRTGIMTDPNNKRERLLGGHAVCIVGYRDIDSRFIVRNSWCVG